MAITFIYKISTTGNQSLDYDMNDKTASVQKKDDSEKSLDYVLRDKREQDFSLSKEYIDRMKKYVTFNEDGTITFKTISSYQNIVNPENVHREFADLRNRFANVGRKKGTVLQYCIVQNFGEEVSPEVANEIGRKFAEKYLSDYQVVISTHINTGYVHNHIEFNATNLKGKNYNDCRQSIADIRKVSDALCEEYGLEVLEATREFNYVRYKDANGVDKIYEPTPRKNEHKEGEVSRKTSYLNTELYRSGVENTATHIQILKKDMDRFIPYATSYEDFLSMMQEVGYSISSKTKSGAWKAHITFKLEDWQKGVRDSNVGEEYEREALTERIRTYSHGMRDLLEFQEESSTITLSTSRGEEGQNGAEYSYGKINIDSIDEEFYRKKRASEQREETRRRYEIERLIIKDTKTANRELSALLGKAMRPQKDARVVLSNNKRTQYYIDRINNGLKTLKFVEDNNIKSIQQMNDVVRSMSEKRNQIYENAKQIKSALQLANKEIDRIQRYNVLKKSIETKSSNPTMYPDYMLTEYQNDVAILKTLESTLKEHKLFTEEQQKQFTEKVNDYTHRYEVMMKALEKVSRQISDYDDTIFNLSMIGKRMDNRYEEEIKAYNEMKQEFKSDRQKKEATSSVIE